MPPRKPRTTTDAAATAPTTTSSTTTPAAPAAPAAAPTTPAPVPTPSAAPAVTSVAATTDDSAKTEKSPPKQPTFDRYGLLVAPARTAAHIKAALAKPNVSAEISRLDALLKVTLDGDAHKVLKANLDDEQKKITRVSNDLPIAMTTLVEAVITELLERGIDDATKGGSKSNVDVRNLHAGDPLPLSPLYVLCPTWRNYSEADEEVQRAAIAEQSKIQRELKAARAAATASGQPLPPAPAKPTVADDDENAEGAGTTFNAYVGKIITNLKLTRKTNKNVRMAVRVVPVISQLVTEMIRSLTNCTEITVREIHDVRTLTVKDFVQTLQTLFAYNHQSVILDSVGQSDRCSHYSPVLEPLLASISQKVGIHARYVEQERAAQDARKVAKEAEAASTTPTDVATA
jgi:hypothetical protein